MQALTKCVPYQNFTTHVDTYNLTMLCCFKQTLSSVTTKQYCKCRLSPNVCLTYQNFTTHVHAILQCYVVLNKHSPVLPLNNTVNAGFHQMCALLIKNFTTHVHTILQYSVLTNHFLNFIKNEKCV